MPRRARTWTAVALLLLLGQGVVLAVAGAAAPGPRVCGVLAMAAAIAAGLALRAGAPRRRALRLGAAASLLLGGLWLASPPDAGRDDRWERERQTGLDAELRRVQAVVPRLAAMADSLVAAEARGLREGADPDLAALRRSWGDRARRRPVPPGASGLARRGTADWKAETGTLPRAAAPGRCARGRAGWYWRGTTGRSAATSRSGSGRLPRRRPGLARPASPGLSGRGGRAGAGRLAGQRPPRLVARGGHRPGQRARRHGPDLPACHYAMARVADRSGRLRQSATAAILALWSASVGSVGSPAGNAGAVAGLVLGRTLWLLAGLAAWLRQAFPAVAAIAVLAPRAACWTPPTSRRAGGAGCPP
ncbi:MAG: hypothetical protein IPI34_10550 [bacterium]|nr:hypothetical protein [bacterium]